MTHAHDESENDCPICEQAFEPADLCATDIELGTCHAACLEGSPTVDLETGDPVDGPITSYRYDEDAVRTAIERAYGILWRDHSRHSADKSIAARKKLLAVLTKEGQKRGIEYALALYGPTTDGEILALADDAPTGECPECHKYIGKCPYCHRPRPALGTHPERHSQEAAAPSEEPITHAEMIEMFGNAMPIEAAKLLWACPPDWTIGKLRSELSAFASPAPVAGVGVSVKALDWEKMEPGSINGHNKRLIVERAITPFGAYFIEQSFDEDSWWLTDGLMGADLAGPCRDKEAQAAAQSDFNARILSSITPATKGGEDTLTARITELEQERDEATNWSDIVDRHGTDQFDDLAEMWLALPEVQRVTNAVTSTFAKWANDELMTRFRNHQLSMFHMAYVEGCLAGVKASEAKLAALSAQDTDGVARP